VKYIFFALISCFLLTQVNCGRKQRSVFYFPVNTVVKINKLVLPGVENVQVISDTKKNYETVTWDLIDQNGLKPYKGKSIVLCGYNIYALTSKGFIQKRPLTKKPILMPPYYNKIKRKHAVRAYCIRPVFMISHHCIEGPMSACVGNKV
jgi:hypothetical protein